jgi:hypothetical protein
MAGPSDTPGSPWPPHAIRPCLASEPHEIWTGFLSNFGLSPVPEEDGKLMEELLSGISPSCGSAVGSHGRMARGGHGLPKVSPGLARPYLSMPCGQAIPVTASWQFLG